MEVRAVAKYIRISPQKVRLVADLVRGKKIQEAESTLLFTRKYASGIIGKVLKSAIANAKQNPNIDDSILYVKAVFVDQGAVFEEMAGPGTGKGRFDKKRMSHITVILDEE